MARNLPRPEWGWTEAAACHGQDLTLFFGRDGERQQEKQTREAKAKQVCARCPVRGDCLDFAVSRPEKYGTWGGLDEDERDSERRRRSRNPASHETSDGSRTCKGSPQPPAYQLKAAS